MVLFATIRRQHGTPAAGRSVTRFPLSMEVGKGGQLTLPRAPRHRPIALRVRIEVGLCHVRNRLDIGEGGPVPLAPEVRPPTSVILFKSGIYDKARERRHPHSANNEVLRL